MTWKYVDYNFLTYISRFAGRPACIPMRGRDGDMWWELEGEQGEFFLFFNFKNRLFQNLFSEYQHFRHASPFGVAKQYRHVTYSGQGSFILPRQRQKEMRSWAPVGLGEMTLMASSPWVGASRSTTAAQSNEELKVIEVERARWRK